MTDESRHVLTAINVATICLMVAIVAYGVIFGVILPSGPPESAETEGLSVPVIPPAVIGKCIMDDVSLNRIESDLAIAQQIAWDWITVEAQCTCNSPWIAPTK